MEGMSEAVFTAPLSCPGELQANIYMRQTGKAGNE